MKRWRIKPRHYVLAAAAAFLLAAVLFTGLLLRDNLAARIVIGLVWTVVGIGWSSRYYQARLRSREEEVESLRANLLAQARQAASQQERSHLARSLHDSIKQQLFGIAISAAAAETRWEDDPEGAREALGDVRRSAQEAMVEMSALLQQLSPAPLEKVGLVQALREQGEALGYRTDAAVTVEFDPLPGEDQLPPGAQESLFRIAQEAFSNIARHARASRVRLYMGQSDADGPLQLEIEDNGQGFSPEQSGSGMGLDNIRQRVLAMQGELTVHSAPGRGTRLRVTIPLAVFPPPREEASDQPSPTLNRLFAAGLGGGLALALLLLYPLYVLLPSRHVAEWPGGAAAFGLLLEIPAALLAVGCGFLAARWTRPGGHQGGALAGALAGAVAGAFLFLLLGAAAADVIGGRTLLAHGLVPAEQTEVVRLLVGALAGMVWWSHGAFWAALLAGTGLGALGGALAPLDTDPLRRPDLAQQAQTILTLAAVAGALSLIGAVRAFALLEPTLQAGLAANDLPLHAVPLLAGISGWLIGTPLVLYWMALLALYLLLRAEIRRSQDPLRLATAQTRAAGLALLALGVPAILAGLHTASLQGTAVLPTGLLDVLGLDHPQPDPLAAPVGVVLLVLGLLGSLGIGGLYLAAMRAAHRRRCEMGFSPPSFLRTALLMSGLLGLGLVSWGARIGAIPPAYVWVALALLVVFSLVLIVHLLRARKQLQSPAMILSQLRSAIARLVHVGPGTAIALTIPAVTTISTVVGMRLIPVPLIEVLQGSGIGGEAAEITLRELVNQIYLGQARAGVLALVAAAAVIGVLTLLVSGIVAMAEQWSATDLCQESE